MSNISHSCMQNCWKLKIHIAPENYGKFSQMIIPISPFLTPSSQIETWHKLSNKIVNFSEFFFFHPVNGIFPQNWAEYLFDGSKPQTTPRKKRNFISDAWFPLHAQIFLSSEYEIFFEPISNCSWAWTQPKGKKIFRPIEISFYGRIIFFGTILKDIFATESSWRSAMIPFSLLSSLRLKIWMNSFQQLLLSSLSYHSSHFRQTPFFIIALKMSRSTFFTPDKLPNV